MSSSTSTTPHPLHPLSICEAHVARDVVLSSHTNSIIDFRSLSLKEPPKAELLPFLELENAGLLTVATSRPARLAIVTYDVIGGDRIAKYFESLVDVGVFGGKLVRQEVVSKPAHAALTL